MYHKIKIDDALFLDRLRYRYALDIVDGMKDVKVYENTLNIPFPYFISDAIRYIDSIVSFENKNGIQKEWAIVSNGIMIGAIGIHFNKGIENHVSEIGYWLHKNYRGKGIMTRVLKEFTSFIFKTYKLSKLRATVFNHNPGSMRALEKASFKSEGTLIKEYQKDSKLIDGKVYGICK